MGEATPKFHRPGTRVVGISLPWMAIGYGLTGSIQTLSFYNAVANDGAFVKPQFVQKIIQNNQLKKEFKPVVLNKQICSSKTIKELKKCMEGVMKKGGTGEKLTSTQFSILVRLEPLNYLMLRILMMEKYRKLSGFFCGLFSCK